MYDIVVLGAGAVGVSTAVNLQLRLPERHVTIVADRYTPDTTSDGAAGIFLTTMKQCPGGEKQFKQWCNDSFQWYHRINSSLDPADTGVLRVSGYELTNTVNKELPFIHGIVYECSEISPGELQSIRGNHIHGWKYTTVMVECRRYLPWLMKRFLEQGGKIEKRKVDCIEQFAGKCNVLVNCAGLGSRTLFDDKDVYPVRGHVIRVKAPWIKHFYTWNDGLTYIYPGQDNVVIGGTKQAHEYDVSTDSPLFDDIPSRCAELAPGIMNADVLYKWSGLRPCRTYVRVDKEVLFYGDHTLQVVHNYGHGADGVALSWGTAVEAAGKVQRLLTETNELPIKNPSTDDMFHSLVKGDVHKPNTHEGKSSKL